MSAGIGVVIVLLFAIVLLLCTKQEERGKTLVLWVLGVGGYFLIRSLGPLAIGGVAWLFESRGAIGAGLGRIASAMFGFLIVVSIPFLIWWAWKLICAAWKDERDKRANGPRSVIPAIPLFVTGIILAIATAILIKPARSYAIAAALLGIDGFFAYAGISQWNPADTVREKMATILIMVSTACGVLALILGCIRSLPYGPAAWFAMASVLTFLVGFFQPKSTKAESEQMLERIGIK